MAVKTELERILASWNLLDHPFYRAWSEGKLPEENLRMYAREYGAWIQRLPAGWEAVGDPATAAEERQHADLWDAFAGAVGARMGAPQTDGAKALLAAADTTFAEPASALGALFAFEAQQPQTSESKLAGLRSHYAFGPSAETYFEVHRNNGAEAEDLMARILHLSPVEQDRAVEGCEIMAQGLWEALTGVTPEALMGGA